MVYQTPEQATGDYSVGLGRDSDPLSSSRPLLVARYIDGASIRDTQNRMHQFAEQLSGVYKQWATNIAYPSTTRPKGIDIDAPRIKI